MALTTQVSYIGKGEVFLQKRGAAGAGLVPIGNCMELQLGISEDKKELQDYTAAGGGTLDTVSRIKAVTAKMTVSNLSAANLGVALRGTVAAFSGGAVTDEAHAAIKLGSLVRLAGMADLSLPITLKVGATVVAAAGNWEAVAAGIWVPPTATGLTDGADITVSYTKLAGNSVEALTRSSDEYTLVFSGLNEARSGKPVVVTVHRLKFSPAKSLDLIADDFGKLEMEADALADATVVGADLSKFVKVEMAEQAA